MAARHATDPRDVPAGSLLVVVHDFVARSPDELSLSKGDRIELIERDDDFGDGWFLGKHLSNGNTGLFPEVYTRPAPKTALPSLGPKPASQGTDSRVVSDDYSSRALANGELSKQDVRAAHMSMQSAPDVTSQNPVMNETLDVIKEHINDMNTPRQSVKRGPSSESGSVYPPFSDPRASYIRGHETDEEESHVHTEQEVLTWTSARVAEYLEDQGVEKQHCDVFREQEISGEVLLNMEQSSIFIKEFELGSVGRRLKTWQKVKALQDEVRLAAIPNVPRSASEYSLGGPDSARAPLHNDGAVGHHRSGSIASSFLSPSIYQGHQRQGSASRSSTTPLPSQPFPADSPVLGTTRTDSFTRPSAQSIRTMQHTRRHSSLGSDISMQRVMVPPGALQTGATSGLSHGRNRSATGGTDRGTQAKRASQYGHKYSVSGSSQAPAEWGLGPMGFTEDLDRGYFSGNEVDKRNRRSVLYKKTPASARHSRQPSESTEAARISYQSQGKVDSPLTTASTNPNIFSKTKGMRSASSPKTVSREAPVSPVVTRLDYDQRSPAFAGSETSSAGHSPSAGTFSFFSRPRATGLRITSDATTIGEKSALVSSPTRTGSTTPSTETRSIEQQKSEQSRLSTGSSQGVQNGAMAQPAPRTRPRARSKKFTSAYTRGLEKKGPREQIEGCDYSGWMKKKSASLVGTWKPRLFVLRGRRLSYYYAESDTEEKGLIDISGHRVLPAENDRMTGLHAQLTGAKAPQSPETGNFQTTAAADLAAHPAMEADDDSGLFIFKLVPPRQGLSKAVNFTKPTVHYFAVNSRQEGRLWMAALMKATIDYDSSGKVTTSYNQPTISLAKARARRERPPALREGEAKAKEDEDGAVRSDSGQGLGIGGLDGTRDDADATTGAESSDAPTAEDRDDGTGSLKDTDAAAFITQAVGMSKPRGPR